MLHKETIMKRNFIITLLLAFTMFFMTACGSNNNDKFEGTWVSYKENNNIQELIIENNKEQSIVSIFTYEYKGLFGLFQSGRYESHFKGSDQVAPIHLDYILKRKSDSIHNNLGKVSENRLVVNDNNETTTILYNEKDNTLLIEDRVFKKKADDNNVKTYIKDLQNDIKKSDQKEIDKDLSVYTNKPNLQFDFYFDDTILDSAQ